MGEIPRLPAGLDRLTAIFQLLVEIGNLAEIIRGFHQKPGDPLEMLEHIKGIAQELHDEVGGMRSTWTQTLSDVHYADTDWFPAILTQVQAIRTNVDTNLPVTVSTGGIASAVWDEPIQPSAIFPNTFTARQAMEWIGRDTELAYRVGFQRIVNNPDFAVGKLISGRRIELSVDVVVSGLRPRQRAAGLTIVDYLNSVQPGAGWFYNGGWAMRYLRNADNQIAAWLVCLVQDQPENAATSPPDARIDELLARTIDEAAANTKILNTDFTEGDYQTELDELLARTAQTAAADQKIVDTDFCIEPPDLVGAEVIVAEGTGTIDITGARGVRLLVTAPTDWGTYTTAVPPIRYRRLGEIGFSSYGGWAQMVTVEMLEQTAIAAVPDVTELRWYLRPGVAAQITVLRPAM